MKSEKVVTNTLKLIKELEELNKLISRKEKSTQDNSRVVSFHKGANFQ